MRASQYDRSTRGTTEKAQDSLRAAKVLASEELYDFAVSRAYYTMFYVAEAFLLSQEMSFSSHAAVISAFGQHFVRTGIVPSKFHRQSIDAQDLRARGDYDVDANLTEVDAAKQITWAEQFLELALQQL